jgi:hypothetical protein
MIKDDPTIEVIKVPNFNEYYEGNLDDYEPNEEDEEVEGEGTKETISKDIEIDNEKLKISHDGTGKKIVTLKKQEEKKLEIKKPEKKPEEKK